MSDYAQLARDCVRRSEFALDQPLTGCARACVARSRSRLRAANSCLRTHEAPGDPLRGLRFLPDNGRNDFTQCGLDRMWRITELAP